MLFTVHFPICTVLKIKIKNTKNIIIQNARINAQLSKRYLYLFSPKLFLDLLCLVD